jgi:hypothetical protein
VRSGGDVVLGGGGMGSARCLARWRQGRAAGGGAVVGAARQGDGCGWAGFFSLFFVSPTFSVMFLLFLFWF